MFCDAFSAMSKEDNSDIDSQADLEQNLNDLNNEDQNHDHNHSNNENPFKRKSTLVHDVSVDEESKLQHIIADKEKDDMEERKKSDSDSLISDTEGNDMKFMQNNSDLMDSPKDDGLDQV